MPPHAPAAVTATASLISARSAIRLRRLQLIQRFLQLFAGSREILQQFHIVIEMNQEGFVSIRPQHLLEEFVASGLPGGNHAPLAAAGIHQQP